MLERGLGVDSNRYREAVAELFGAARDELRNRGGELTAELRSVLANVSCSEIPQVKVVSELVCALVKCSAVPEYLQKLAILVVVNGINDLELPKELFYRSFDICPGNAERALYLSALAVAATEGSGAQGLLREVFLSSFSADGIEQHSVAKYLRYGCPEYKEWLSLGIAIQRQCESSDRASMLDEALRVAPERTASFIAKAINNIGDAPAQAPAKLYLSSGFLKCSGSSLKRDEHQVKAAVISCYKALTSVLTLSDTVKSAYISTILAADSEIAVGLLNYTCRYRPEIMGSILSVKLDRRRIMVARGASEDLIPSQNLAIAAGRFMVSSPVITPEECLKFLVNNQELVYPEINISLLRRLSDTLERATGNSLLPLVEELKDGMFPALFPAVTKYLGKFGTSDAELNWLVGRAEQIPDDMRNVLSAMAAVSERICVGTDGRRSQGMVSAAKRLRALRQTRRSFRKIARMGGVKDLHKAIKAIESFSPVRRVVDFVFRNIFKIRRS